MYMLMSGEPDRDYVVTQASWSKLRACVDRCLVLTKPENLLRVWAISDGNLWPMTPVQATAGFVCERLRVAQRKVLFSSILVAEVSWKPEGDDLWVVSPEQGQEMLQYCDGQPTPRLPYATLWRMKSDGLHAIVI